ncbi:MAG: hypothetical protein V4443_00875 [Pseudomonadota bacterium]
MKKIGNNQEFPSDKSGNSASKMMRRINVDPDRLVFFGCILNAFFLVAVNIMHQ